MDATYTTLIADARELLCEQIRDPVNEANPEYTRGVVNLIAEAFGEYDMDINMVRVALDIGLRPADRFFTDYADDTISYAKELAWSPAEEADQVVVVTTYGGHEADTEVYGAYTKEEAVAKLKELAGSEDVGEPVGMYGGFDYDDGDRVMSVTQMSR